MQKRQVVHIILAVIGTCLALGILLWLQANMAGAQSEIPIIPPELLRQLQAEQSAERAAGQDCQIFGNASPVMGSELTAGKSLTVTFTHIGCNGAMVTNFHGGATLTGVTSPGEVCYALSDELTASVCVLSGTQVVSNSVAVSQPGQLHATISQLSPEAPVLWEAFWQVVEEVLRTFLPLVAR